MPSLLGGLLWLVVLGLSQAQNEVTIEQGPLYRTVGSNITIWCKESGYRGTANLEFQYFVRLPSAPELEINVVSSDKPNFSYAKYSQRVLSGNINVERVSKNHTVLHIINLQEGDTGEYECYTPNTAATFDGTYSAKINLTVIPNTLQVSMAPQTVTTSEGASLELTCQVSMASSQHTHLSISWFLSTDSDAEILTLTRDFVLHPGGAFSERFMAGDVRLDKLSESSYRLTIGALHQSDQGEIFCRGSEWIQDPSGAWTKIAEKDSEKTNVKVAAVQGGDFEVQVKASAEVLTPGRPLEVTCSVSNTSPSGGQFRVVWQLSGTMKAIWEPSGVVTFRSELSSAGAEGRLAVHRRDLTSWVLRISQVRIEDGGSYVCEVTDERSKKRTSKPTSVEVKLPEFRTPEISLTAVPPQPYEGDSVSFHCQVSASSSSPASLGWFRRAVSGERTHVVSVLQDGRLVIGADYRQRHNEAHLLAEKADSGLFMLRMDDVTQSDVGEYFCRYSEGTQNSNGDQKNVTTDSKGVQIDIRRLDSTLKVSLMTRNSKPTLGSTASLYCNARADFTLSDRRRLVWSWFFQPSDRQGPFQSLVQGPGNGELVWGDSYPSFKGKAQISLSANKAVLQIHRVQRLQQSGTYRCGVTILSARSGVTLATVSSSDVTMKVQLPDTKLRLDSTSRPLVLTTGQEEAAVTCKILERTPGTDLSVIWFFRPPSSASQVEVLKVDHGGVTIQDPSSRPRFISRQSPADSFSLRILRPGLGEVGGFHCAVQEWLQEETGNWIQVGEGISGDTQITFAASDQTLKLSEQNVSSSVKLGEDLVLPCPLEVEPSPSSLLSISWFQQGWDFSPPRLLYRSDRDGVTEYKDGRLRMVVPRRGNYILVLQSAGHMDGGRYFCRVEEWQLQEGEWKMTASDQSGVLEILVTLPDRLSLNRTDLTLLVPQQSTVTLPCQVLAVSLPSSPLSISWWKAGGPGAPHTLLFAVNHTGEFIYPQEKKDRLQYERPSELIFHLRIHGSHVTDSGTYHCGVQEWLRNPRGAWEPMEERQSGQISVTIQTADRLSLNRTDLALLVPQQSTVTLPCQVLAVSLPSSPLSISWWKAGGPGAPHTLLFAVNHTGEFIYPQEKKDRLQYERPSELIFHLRIHGSHVTDSGTYHCGVQEWLRNPRGAWEPMEERQSGQISVTIQTADARSEVCTSPPLFHFLLAFTVLFLILVLTLVALAWWRLRSRRGGGARRPPGTLWSPVMMSEVENGEGTIPVTLPTTLTDGGNPSSP